jgi:hypothetical protein
MKTIWESIPIRCQGRRETEISTRLAEGRILHKAGSAEMVFEGEDVCPPFRLPLQQLARMGYETNTSPTDGSSRWVEQILAAKDFVITVCHTTRVFITTARLPWEDFVSPQIGLIINVGAA